MRRHTPGLAPSNLECALFFRELRHRALKVTELVFAHGSVVDFWSVITQFPWPLEKALYLSPAVDPCIISVVPWFTHKKLRLVRS